MLLIVFVAVVEQLTAQCCNYMFEWHNNLFVELWKHSFTGLYIELEATGRRKSFAPWEIGCTLLTVLDKIRLDKI